MVAVIGVIKIINGGSMVAATYDMPLRGESRLAGYPTHLFLWDDGAVTWKETRE